MYCVLSLVVLLEYPRINEVHHVDTGEVEYKFNLE